MKNRYVRIGLGALTLIVGAAACSSGFGPLDGATSQLCSDVNGLEAIYFDLVNGVPRGDLPSTAYTIPFDIDFNQSPYSNQTNLLLGFMVPQGWNVAHGQDLSGFGIPGTTVAADLTRADNRAVWRYVLNSQVTGGFSSQAILEAEINTRIAALGNPGAVTSVCAVNAQTTGILGPESVAARLLRVGDFTLVSRVHVIVIPGTSAFYSSFTSVAPTSESEQVINDIFVPMITQLSGGGSSDPAQCSDGIDNDNDGATDYPSDGQCTGPGDDSEGS